MRLWDADVGAGDQTYVFCKSNRLPSKQPQTP